MKVQLYFKSTLKNCQTFCIKIIVKLPLVSLFLFLSSFFPFLFVQHADPLLFSAKCSLISWWFPSAVIGCYAILFALPCSKRFKKEENKLILEPEESILFTDYKLLSVCWSALCSGYLFFLTCLDAQITKQKDKKIFQNLCLLCCKLSNHTEHKNPRP